MHIRFFCIKQPIYADFIRNSCGTCAYKIQIYRHKDTDLSAYTYGCVGLHIRKHPVKRLFVPFQAFFSSGIFVRIYGSRYFAIGYGFSLRYFHS